MRILLQLDLNGTRRQTLRLARVFSLTHAKAQANATVNSQAGRLFPVRV